MARSVFERLTILVVDDSPYMLRLLSGLLGALGVGEIVTAADGDEAWSKFLSHRPDVVLTDAAMKPTDGFALTRKLRAVDRRELGTVPIIMVSAHSELSAVERARDAGISDFICKPVSARTIYERLIDVVNRPREFIESASFTGPDRRRPDDSFSEADRRGPVAFL
ncbi:MAG TPA: response regulator [Parvibaculum sp.]